MAASTLVVALAGAWVVPPPPVDPLGDLQRAERERTLVQAILWSAPRAGCARTGDEDILVCGRQERSFRVESVPLPGARRRLIAGEPPSGALAGGGCIQRCHQPVQVDIISATLRVVGLLERLID